MNKLDVEKIMLCWLSQNVNYKDEKMSNLFVTPICNTPYTDAFKCETDNVNIPVFFVKRKIKELGDKDGFSEYQTLRNLWKNGYKSGKKYLIPKPYDYLKEPELLITEFVEGQKFTRFFLWNNIFPMSLLTSHRIESAIIRIAKWIADYETKLSKKVIFNTDDLLNEFGTKNIKEIKNIDSIQKKEIDDGLRDFGKNFKNIPGYSTNIDFKVHNIMLKKNHIVIFDWEKMRDQFPVFWMASSFIRSLYYSSNRWFISSSSTDKLVNLFLEKYIETSPFSSYKEIFPLIRAFEIILYLKEKEYSVFEQSKKERHLSSLRNILNI